ncbi:MAG TPA: hypothetical protein VL426_02755 [Candidatus Binatia bacterium]|jgi:hypothetical protein|nr:hypothetical protein [Candidatus Binatia bacterium]
MPRTYKDEARWDGVEFVSVDVGARNKSDKLIFNGYQYATRGERQLAELLWNLGIAFTPDVPFWLPKPDGRSRLFVPDFILDKKPYLWHARRRPMLIHGIEAKGKTRNGTFSERALENVQLLRQHRGIVVLLLSNSQIKQYFNKGRLPLSPLDLPAE